MAVKRSFNICFGRKYTTKNNEEKTAWMKIGKLFIGEDNKVFGTLEAIPTNWDGHFNCFSDEPKQPTGATPTAEYSAMDKATPNLNDDLPF